MSDPFATLGVEPRFDLDEADLHRRFIRRTAEHHPDRFTDPLEQADAAGRAAAVNDAYRVLREPESRADALVRLLGGPTAEDDKSLPPDLLAEMMEVRERQEEAVENADAAALTELADWARRRRAEHLDRVARLFGEALASAGEARDAALRQVRLELNALRYFQRMLEQLP